MNYKDNDMWDWQVQDYDLEDDTSIEISKCLLNGVNQNEDPISHMLDDETTPIRGCGDLAYHVTKNEVRKNLEQCREPSSQVKRRRMLQFESEVLDVPLCSDEAFLRSKETQDSLEDAISEMSQWVAGYTDVPATSNECLDPSSERWIANCFSDEMHLCTENIDSISGASDVQIDITDLCDTPPEFDANAVTKQPMRTHRDVLKGKKSFMRSPSKLSSSIVYPFAFIKPCGAHGDMTLKDINRKILNPPKSRQSEEEEDPSVSYPTSAFSGKPVVVKTKIHTEGRQGSITIMRTKG